MLSIIFGSTFVLLCVLHNVICVNILCLMPVPSPSHHIWNKVLMNKLASEGHNLTILSADVDKNPPSSITYLHMPEVYSEIYSGNFSIINLANETILESIVDYYDYALIACNGVFKSKAFAQLLNYPNDFKFDLVIFDFTLAPCQLGFLEKFNYPPLIGVTAFNNPPFSHHIIGGHKYYAYIPHYILPYSSTEMNFWQRGFNTFIYGVEEIYRAYFIIPTIDKLMKKAFNNPNLPYAEDLEKLSQIILVNSNPAIDYPQPVPPNLIQVGGLQIQPAKPLPTDLEEFVAKSKKGFVLFSLGTNVRSDELSADKRQMFIDAMASFPEYNFLWKFESDLGLILPKNVVLRQWLPQTDLLGHPKIKAFITHAGLLSTHESLWYGVPMVAIPFYIDQKRNAHRLVELGLGEKIIIGEADKNTVIDALSKVLMDPSYTHKIKQLSTIFKDTPKKPLDTAIWWIEYVLRNPTSTHLRSPTHKLGFIRSNLYDIIGSLILLIVTVIYVFYKILSRGRITSALKLKKN